MGREHDQIDGRGACRRSQSGGRPQDRPAGARRRLARGDAGGRDYVEETITHSGILQQHLPWSQPRSFFRAGGGLGQGLGTALGVKPGAANRPVAALIGDGSFLYNPVVQALGAAKGNDLPILIVVCNNGQYRAMPVRNASGPSAPLPRRCRATGRHVAPRDDRWSRLRRVRQAFWLRRAKGRGPGRASRRDPIRNARCRARQDRDPQRRADPVTLPLTPPSLPGGYPLPRKFPNARRSLPPSPSRFAGPSLSPLLGRGLGCGAVRATSPAAFFPPWCAAGAGYLPRSAAGGRPRRNE